MKIKKQSILHKLFKTNRVKNSTKDEKVIEMNAETGEKTAEKRKNLHEAAYLQKKLGAKMQFFG